MESTDSLALRRNRGVNRALFIRGAACFTGAVSSQSVIKERAVIAYILRRAFYGVLILLGVNLMTFALFFSVNT